MKKILQGLLIASTGLLVSLFTILTQYLPTQAAAGTKIYLSPGSNSVTTGNNFTYTIMIDTAGESIDSAGVRLSYDQSKVSFVSIDGSASAFTIAASESGSGGTVAIDRGVYPAVSGVQEIAKVTFRANTAGSAGFSFAGGTVALRGGTNYLGTTSGATTTINGTTTTNPPPTPPPAPAPTPTPTPTSGGTKPTTTSTSSTTQVSTKPNVVVATPNIQKTSSNAPNITNIKATVGFKSINVSFSTDKPTRATVEYGLNSKLGLTATDSELKTEHSMNLNVDNLKPGETYYYRIKATSATGEVSTTDTIKLVTKGYTIRLLVKDTLGRPIANQPVTLYSDPLPGTTDAQGIVVYDNIAPGKHTLTATYKDQTYKKEIEVKDTLGTGSNSKVNDNTTIPVQTIAVVLRSDKDLDLSLILLIAGIAAGLALLGLGVYWVYRAIKNSHHNHPSELSDNAGKFSSGSSSSSSPTKTSASSPKGNLKENVFDPKSLSSSSDKSAPKSDNGPES